MQINSSTSTNSYPQSSSVDNSSQISSLQSSKQELESERNELLQNNEIDDDTKQSQIQSIDSQIQLIESQIQAAKSQKSESSAGLQNSSTKANESHDNGDEVRSGVVISSSLKEKLQDRNYKEINNEEKLLEMQKKDKEQNKVYTYNEVHTYTKDNVEESKKHMNEYVDKNKQSKNKEQEIFE
ncbi:hypothetical protein FDF86_11100 [Clostridium botulinum]|nr:hypothetical protein [Clostridium botulinum]